MFGKIKKLFVFCVCCFCLGFSVFCEDTVEKSDFSELKKIYPVRMYENSDGSSALVIKTNISDVNVYLNGNFQGKTELEVGNLVPGVYELLLQKPGYEDEKCEVEVSDGMTLKYEISMSEILGTIEILNMEPETYVQIEGYHFRRMFSASSTKSDYRTEVAPGKYLVTIRKFGCEIFNTEIEVFPYEVTNVEYELVYTEMLISDFRQNKTAFNPDYNNNAGRVIFTFVVSSSAPVKAYIKNSEGEDVWVTEWSTFTNWKQGFVWDGLNKEKMEKVPDGDYVAYISSDHFEYELPIKVDRKIVFPLFSPTVYGSGIGNLPSLFAEKQTYFSPFITVVPIIHKSAAGVNFYDAKTTAGFICRPSNNFEYTLSGNLNPGYEKALFGGNAAFKIFDTKYVEKVNASFSYGGLLRYGISNDAFVNTKGIDTGNGLGIGALFNADTEFLNAGLSSQFIFGSQRGLLNWPDNLWKNGATVSLKMGNEVRVDSWFALCSYFGNTNYWARGLDTGLNVSIMMGSSDSLLNMNFSYVNIFKNDHYFAQSFGLFYLF